MRSKREGGKSIRWNVICITRGRNRIIKKRSDKNSATSAVAGFVGAINDRIPLPAGVELRSEAELII